MPEQATYVPHPQSQKPLRVLSCVLCQQRKVKCDRKFPCANCVKHQAQCVPATQGRPRRRRFPERELLERLRRYEDLLRKNNIRFEPLHKDAADAVKLSLGTEYDSDDAVPEAGGSDWSSPSSPFPSGNVSEPKYAFSSISCHYMRLIFSRNIWHALTQIRGPKNDSDPQHDSVREVVVKKAWDQAFDNDDNILFGSRKTAVDISTFHPEPVHIFRLWQIYLDNVDPLLKVTHTPSLQGRIIEAASNVSSISSTLEALVFGIYCISVTSLTPDDCLSTFNMSKDDLLTKYHFGAQQALSNCSYLRTDDRECLTAMYLYLISAEPGTHPRSLASMLGVVMRIAMRMGIHNESYNIRCTVFEAEMRRRLWWSLMLFDTRIGEKAGFKNTMLAPGWDCNIPLNVNDSDLRPEMKESPRVSGRASEALFAVVRSELGEFSRHSPCHLDFTNPALKPIAKQLPNGGSLDTFERRMVKDYLSHCDPTNPIHFMTICAARAHLYKSRLKGHYARFSNSAAPQTEAQREAAMNYAFDILESDTNIVTSPLSKGYHWLLHLHFPFPAYMHIVQELRRKPLGTQTEKAWEVMSDNYEVRFAEFSTSDSAYSPLFKLFTGVVLSAWAALEAVCKQSKEPLNPPRIVSSVRQKIAEMEQNAQDDGVGHTEAVINQSIDDPLMPTSKGLGSNILPYGMGGQTGFSFTEAMVYPNLLGQAPLNIDMHQLNWPPMEWGSLNSWM